MICVEGFKAFEGVMKIIPVNRPNFEIEAQWLYKPDSKCWYAKGSSYPEEICEIVRETK